MRAPSVVSEQQLKDVHIEVKKWYNIKR
jgi:hypothetical protein